MFEITEGILPRFFSPCDFLPIEFGAVAASQGYFLHYSM
jgi:hypothetical protein